MIQHERRDVQESVPGPKCLANTLCQLTGIYIPTWRLVRERENDLEEGVTCKILKFADDTKLFRKTRD